MGGKSPTSALQRNSFTVRGFRTTKTLDSTADYSPTDGKPGAMLGSAADVPTPLPRVVDQAVKAARAVDLLGLNRGSD